MSTRTSIQGTPGTLKANGIELSYTRWPGASKKPLVCIHGLTANRLFFAGMVERLAGRQAAIAADLRGRGDSEKPAAGPYGIATHADDVAAMMRALDLGPTVVVGHSLGAYIATAVAAAHPELVKGLVLIDGGYTPELPMGITLELLKQTYLAPILQRLVVTHAGVEAHRKAWKAMGLFKPEEWTPWVDAYVAHGATTGPEVREKALALAASEDFVDMTRRIEVEARLSSVRCPTLLIRATEGYFIGSYPVVSEPVVAHIRAMIPHLEDHILRGATHYTILLGDPGATACADLVDALAKRV